MECMNGNRIEIDYVIGKEIKMEYVLEVLEILLVVKMRNQTDGYI